MNRRVRNRTHGGVRGRGPQDPLLLDSVFSELLAISESYHLSGKNARYDVDIEAARFSLKFLIYQLFASRY